MERRLIRFNWNERASESRSPGEWIVSGALIWALKMEYCDDRLLKMRITPEVWGFAPAHHTRGVGVLVCAA
jgi:hypothetical protein